MTIRPGPATYRTPEMDVSGELMLKRQYIIKAGVLQDVFDTGISIGDEMLQQMLSRSADEKMHSIVTTIQREQNQIIRDDRHKVLVVQGAAGSGKTSVALQRIAYLLYKYRTTLSADNMILFSPNSLVQRLRLSRTAGARRSYHAADDIPRLFNT